MDINSESLLIRNIPLLTLNNNENTKGNGFNDIKVNLAIEDEPTLVMSTLNRDNPQMGKSLVDKDKTTEGLRTIGDDSHLEK